MLVVHHLGVSQSERIVWLCEELGLDYELRHHVRDPATRLSPPALLALHPNGTAPVIEEDGVLLGESAAIVEYIFARHGDGGLARHYGQPSFPDYLYWFHFANGMLQPAIGRQMVLTRGEVPPEAAIAGFVRSRLHRALLQIDTRVTEHEFLAGDGFSAADIMTVFSLTTMRRFSDFDIGYYQAILAYLQRIAARPAYRRAMEKGDPGMPLRLT